MSYCSLYHNGSQTPRNVKYDPDLMTTFRDLFKTLYIFIIFSFTCVYTIPIESLNFVWLILNLVRTGKKKSPGTPIYFVKPFIISFMVLRGIKMFLPILKQGKMGVTYILLIATPIL